DAGSGHSETLVAEPPGAQVRANQNVTEGRGEAEVDSAMRELARGLFAEDDDGAPVVPAATPGTRLGHYEVVEPIGAGGMGEVYRARDPRIGRDVAIKLLPAEMHTSSERLRRFER